MNFTLIKNSSRAAQEHRLGACLLALLLALSSCGGSSSTTALQNTLPSPVAGGIKGEVLVPAPVGTPPAAALELAALPLITLNQRQFADPNVLLNLNGTVTAATGATIVTTLWTQVTGPAVRIPSPLQLNNEIIIPDVAVATTLEFRLTAQDSKGKINSATVSILVKPVPSFVKVIGGVFNEADKVAVFTLRLNAASNLPVTFSYTTQDGTALSGNDYTLTSGQIIFAAGEISKTISVPLIDDTLSENDETFSLQVTAVDGDAAHSSSGVAIIHSDVETLAPRNISFTTVAPAPIQLNSQYANPLTSSPGSGAVLYTSSNPLVATVDANGLVTALAKGSTTITAIKAADNLYAAAQASYELKVVKGSVPVVVIDDSMHGSTSTRPGFNDFYTTKSQLGLYGNATDAEDGSLYPKPNEANSPLLWTSDIDGILGYNGQMIFDNFTQGTHTVTLSATDSDGNTGSASILVFGGNLGAGLAKAQDEKIVPPCSAELNNMLDADLTTAYNAGCNGKGLTYVTWLEPVVINTIELYTAQENPIALYTIEYLESSSGLWKFLLQDPGNRPANDVHHIYPVANITTSELRIAQPKSGQINELVIFGHFSSATVTPVEFIKPGPASIQVAEQYYNPLVKSPAATGDIEYTSSNPLVASVDYHGHVTAIAAGTTTIRARAAVNAYENRYATTEASYELQVKASSGVTVAVIHDFWGEQMETLSRQPGDDLGLFGLAYRDGNQISSAPYISWNSNRDGYLGDASGLGQLALSQGTHTLSVAAGSDSNNLGTASATVFFGNLAALAIATDPRYPNCSGDPSYINDSNLITTHNPGCRGEGLISLAWGRYVIINTIELYTNPSAPIEHYRIEYLEADTGLWKLLLQDPGNRAATDLHHTYPVANITTRELRLVQPKSGSINELLVFGVEAAP